MKNPTAFDKGSLYSKNCHWQGSVSIQEQIAYIAIFYPTPNFVEMTFDDTSASSNQSDNSQNSITDSSSSSGQQHRAEFQSPKGNHSIGCNGLSEIKAKSFRFDFDRKKSNQNGKRSVFQTQFDYEQLIGELSFQENIQQKFHFSAQKNIQNFDGFRPEQKDNSFISQKKKGYSDPDQKYVKAKLEKKNSKSSTKSRIQQNQKWDPPLEVLFRKQNKLKWMANIISIRETKKLQDAFNKIWYQSKNKTRLSAKSKRAIKQNFLSKADSNLRSKDRSMIIQNN